MILDWPVCRQVLRDGVAVAVLPSSSHPGPGGDVGPALDLGYQALLVGLPATQGRARCLVVLHDRTLLLRLPRYLAVLGCPSQGGLTVVFCAGMQ